VPHIIVPEPDIDLYKTGFEEDVDLLRREDTGKSLSELVMRIDDPLVIALDGGWGSGKSFFLKCWVGAHLKDHGDTSQTVYFDAFEHDFIDAPLVSLLTRMAERFPHLDTDNRKRLQKVKTSADDIWKQAAQQHNAMEEFRTALKGLTQGDDAPQKLIIVIDELDRCRPDYALSLLEIIKHFFAVPNVHFVLGVNMVQLENSVRARYGAGIDAGLYLQKFVGLSMRLPNQNDRYQGTHAIRLFESMADSQGLNSGQLTCALSVMELSRDKSKESLRGAQRFLAALRLSKAPTSLNQNQSIILPVHTSLVLMKSWFPKQFEAARQGDLSMDNIAEIFSMSEAPSPQDGFSYTLFMAWLYYIDAEKFEKIMHPEREISDALRAARLRDLQQLVLRNVDVFTIPPDMRQSPS